MVDAFKFLGSELRENWKRFFLHGFVFALIFQAFMLIALMVRFQALPNYIQFYDWLGNIVTIVQSTPSWADIAKISVEEWLIEIGQMNYDYGTGLSIWSLNVVPSRIVVLTMMGGLVALCIHLVKQQSCAAGTRRTAITSLGGGTILVAMTNATMSWVVCCATPSWVVGLAMLGLGVSTSLALESLGPVLSLSGFSLLLLSALLLAWRNVRQPSLMAVPENA